MIADGRFVPVTSKPILKELYHYVVGCMSWMFAGQDLMFNSGEIAEAMRNVGFSSVESEIVETSTLTMALDIARK